MQISVVRNLALALVAALAGSLPSCATRTVPPRVASGAAASNAIEAPPHPIAVSLRDDPPLPGESIQEWQGLDEDAGQASPRSAVQAETSHGGHVHGR